MVKLTSCETTDHNGLSIPRIIHQYPYRHDNVNTKQLLLSKYLPLLSGNVASFPIYILKPIFIFCLNNIYKSVTCRTFRTLNFYVPTKENPPSQETQGVEDSTGIVLEEVRMRIPPRNSTCIFIQCQMITYLMLILDKKRGGSNHPKVFSTHGNTTNTA